MRFKPPGGWQGNVYSDFVYRIFSDAFNVLPPIDRFIGNKCSQCNKPISNKGLFTWRKQLIQVPGKSWLGLHTEILVRVVPK